MKISELVSHLSLIIVFFLLLGFSFFNIDLIKKRKNKARIKKLIFILKNGNLLFAVICVCQVLLNIFMSDVFMTSIGKPVLKEFKKTHYRWAFLLGLGLSIALFTEIF